VTELVTAKVKSSQGRISAKRLLPAARGAGYEGSPRNFRRLVGEAKVEWRRRQYREGGRRPAVWTPGETLVVDWGEERLDGPISPKVLVFCAVLAWSRFRFVRFAADQQATTMLAMLAECFEVIGGFPKVVLADRMGWLRGGVVANVVVPTPDYVRFATHHGFRSDFCNAEDPESKGIVENLVGYAKDDLLIPLSVDDDSWKGEGSGLARVIARAASWCAEVNAAVHSEICAIPAERLAVERGLLGALPSLRLQVGPKPITRKVDKLSCIRFLGSLLGPERVDREDGHGAGRRTRQDPAGRRARHR
jgi:transposase